jgi:putative exporter of polyketide antibiotics
MGARIFFVFSWFLFITMITPIIKMIREQRDFYMEQGFAMGVSRVGQRHSNFLSDPIGRLFK